MIEREFKSERACNGDREDDPSCHPKTALLINDSNEGSAGCVKDSSDHAASSHPAVVVQLVLAFGLPEEALILRVQEAKEHAGIYQQKFAVREQLAGLS